MRTNYRKSLKFYRRSLRQNMTPAEAILWRMINKHQLAGVRFLRQYSIGSYIVDFYCPSARLAIELDGQCHFEESQIEYDERRTTFLNQQGVRVLRFENCEIFDYSQRTLDEILKYIHSNENPENILRKD